MGIVNRRYKLLRANILEFSKNWDIHLSLIEFAYNNRYQSSIGMPPYKALYERKCKLPLYRDQVGEQKILEPKMVQEIIQVIEKFKKSIVATQYRQQSYANKGRRPLEFEVSDNVFITIAKLRDFKVYWTFLRLRK